MSGVQRGARTICERERKGERGIKRGRHKESVSSRGEDKRSRKERAKREEYKESQSEKTSTLRVSLSVSVSP